MCVCTYYTYVCICMCIYVCMWLYHSYIYKVNRCPFVRNLGLCVFTHFVKASLIQCYHSTFLVNTNNKCHEIHWCRFKNKWGSHTYSNPTRAILLYNLHATCEFWLIASAKHMNTAHMCVNIDVSYTIPMYVLTNCTHKCR